jgi:hypothetical protein
MSNIDQNNFRNCNVRLSNSDYWDLYLSTDCGNPILDHASILSGSCLLIDIDFNNDNTISGDTIYNLVNWSGATINKTGLTLNDIGLTGIDNGFFTYNCSGSTTGSSFINIYTGSSLTLTSADTKFFMTKVDGCQYWYPIDFISGGTQGRYAQFCGGFYQGFYKLSDQTFFKEIDDNKFTWPISAFTVNNYLTGNTLSGDPYNYQTLPDRYEKGWTAIFWINKDSDPCTGYTYDILNDIYPDNEGFFYYMGTRSENKFWNVFSGESGYTTSSGYPLQPPIITEQVLNDNPFLVYNGSNLTTGLTFTGITTVTTQEKNRYVDIIDNAIGFRITNDGAIGYRKLTVTGVCSGETYITGVTIVEEYTEVNQIQPNEWNQISIKFESYETYKECDLKYGEKRKGKLFIYVNSLLKKVITDFDEFLFKELYEHREKQQGVSFTYSLGGGTQGLIESNTIGGPDDNDFELSLQENFAGTFIGGISSFKMYGCALDVTTLRNDFFNNSNKYNTVFLDVAEVITDRIFYGKLTGSTIELSDVPLLSEYMLTNDVIDIGIVIPDEYGYSYILIPENLEQPNYFYNNLSTCSGMIIPFVDEGILTLHSVNYIVYKFWTATYAEVPVWMCV